VSAALLVMVGQFDRRRNFLRTWTRFKDDVGAVFACIPLFSKRGNRDELGRANI